MEKLKNKRSLWLITGLLLIAYFILGNRVFGRPDFSKLSGPLVFAVSTITNLLFVFGVGFVLGKMSALFLFKKLNHRERFQRTFPIATSFALLVILLFFSYVAYLEKVRGVKLRPLIEYDEVETPLNVDCATVRNGSFETEKISITRSNQEQIQTSKENGEKSEFKVAWISDCEYVLTPKESPSDMLRVKIVDVREDEYDCFVTAKKYASKQTIKRMSTDDE